MFDLFDDKTSMVKWKNTWPWILAKALPDLLQHLCSHNKAPSLERMQLVDIKIDLHDDVAILDGQASFANVGININHPAKDRLVLSGDLISGSSHVLSLTVGYFLRGERQFLKTNPLDLVFIKNEVHVKEADIKSFFSSIDQDNNYFYDQALSHLNGRPMPSIPSQMILAWLLHYILSSDTPTLYRGFYFAFHAGISLKSRLEVGQTNHLADKYFALFADDACAVSVQITE